MDETIDIKNLTVQEKLSILIEDLPDPIKRFVQSPERDAISLKLSQKYNLHADDAGVFDQAYIFMLLGIYTPDEFVSELRNASFNSDTIRGLTNDVNEMVFKKLRDEEQKQLGVAEPVRDDLVPVMNIVPKLEQPILSIPVPVTPQVQQPEQTPAPVPPPQTVAPVTTIHPRTMQQDMQLVQQGNLHDAELGAPIVSVAPIPTIIAPVPASTVVTAPPQYAARPQAVASSPYVAPIAPPAWHSSAAASFQTASIPNTAPSELNMPRYSAPPQNQIPPAPEPFVRPAIAAEPQPRSAPSPITKEYGADPYRELPQ